MESVDATPRAVAYAALLHLGIVGFLALAMLNCTRWEHLADALRLPDALRPVTCSTSLRVEGPVIEAVLVGPVAAPLPAAARRAQRATSSVLPSSIAKPAAAANVRVLPTPVPQPQLEDRSKVAEHGEKPAAQPQEQAQRQRMAELTREQEAERIMRELAKVKAQSQAQQRRIKLEQQKSEQLADLRKASDSDNAEQLPVAAQAMTGQGGQDAAGYAAALTNVITRNWGRPFDLPPGSVCPIEIRQTRGGQVQDVKILPSCPLNDVGRHSVQAAVWRSSPLPYKGFEKVFVPDLTLNFTVSTQQ